MANIKFNKGVLANLPAQSVEGALYFTTDESIYLGLANGAYHRFGDFIEVANVASLPENGAHAKALYYCTAENVLAKWTGTEWKQINLNTTYTIAKGSTDGSIKLVGSNGTSEELQVVDVAGLESAIAEAKAQADKGVADAKTADDKAVAAQEAVDALAEKVGTITEGKTVGGEIADLKATVGALTGGEEGAGSISEAIDAKIDALKLAETYEPIGKGAEEAGKVQDALDTYIESNNTAVAEAKKAGTDAQTYAEGVNTALETYKTANDKALADEIARAKEVEGTNKELAEGAMAEAQKKVASVTAGDASVTVAGTSTAPTVAVKLDPSADNAIKLGENGLKVEIGAAPEYSVVKDENSGEFAAVYHLTKDGVNVGSAINIPKDMVVKSGSVVDGNIVLVLNDEANTEITIPADSLIEYVTSGSVAGDMVVINVDESTHKVTATITDGTIGLAKLTTEVQTAIGKAHSHENADVLAGITADKVEAWDSAEADAIAEATRLDSVLKGELQAEIKAVDDKFANYTDTEGMNAAIKAVDDKFANYKTATEVESAIKVETDRAVAKEAELVQDIADVDAKFVNYSTTEQMNGAIEAVNTALDARLDTLEAIDHDAYKAYSEGVANTAETNAKAYVDGMFQWGEF